MSKNQNKAERKMTTLNKLIGSLLLLTFFLALACEQKSPYERLLEAELASGERYDSLFLGLRFGMTSKEFFTACWDLNKQGLVRQGTRNATVVYDVSEELPHAAKMDFYPRFYEDRIVEMPAVFRYDGWSPWNRHLWADSLQLDVVKLLEDWHGDGFIRADHPELGSAYVKVDGNRRIAVTALDDQLVQVTYTDLSVELPEPQPRPVQPVKEEEQGRSTD